MLIDTQKIAIDLDSKGDCIKDTRGSVLIEKGAVDEGVSLINGHVDLRFADSTTLAGAIYLCLASHIKEDKKEERRYFNYITANADKLETDEQALWGRIRGKMEEGG
jgi:hypothetical protein